MATAVAGRQPEGVSSVGPYRATLAPRHTTQPRYDLDYTGALIPAPRGMDQCIWPGLWWAQQRQAANDSYDAWCRDKDVQIEQNERQMVSLHRAQEAQVALSDRNFWTTMENCNADADERTSDRRAVIEGPAVANGLRELTSATRSEKADMYRRQWEQHQQQSAARLEILHAAQDSTNPASDHAVNNYRFYGPIGTRGATGAILAREAAEEARRKVVVRRAQEESSDRLTPAMYHMCRADLEYQKACEEAAFWKDQQPLRQQTLQEVKAENTELQRALEENCVEDARLRQADRDAEAAERSLRYKQMMDVRAERAVAEADADRAELERRRADEDAHRAEYKAIERAALEAEAEIKTSEMKVLSRIISHQG